MRHLVATSTAVVAVGALLVAPTTPTGATPAPDHAVERLNRGHYAGGSVPTPAGSTPRVELTADAVFHVYPGGSVWSYRYGTSSAWAEAPTAWSNVVTASSGTGDYVVGVESAASTTSVVVAVETVVVGGTAPATGATIELPRVPGTGRAIDVAAAGDHVYVAVSQGLATGDRSTVLVTSDDRGATWSDPVDLLAAAGVDDTGARTELDVQAEGETVAVAVDTDRLLVSTDAAGSFRPVATIPDDADERGPLSVATDGSSVRVAWLRRDDGSVTARSTAIHGDGSLAVVSTVPTAPSPLAGGVDTEIVLARLGSTYALQADGGRLVSLDPDGTWRWPLPTEPTDTYDDCRPDCPPVLPAAVYGDRLVHRRMGYFGYWFIDRTPSRLVVLEGAPVMRSGRRVLVRVDDDGALSKVTCQHGDGRLYEASGYPWYCYVQDNRRRGPHTLTVRATDLAGNVTVLHHRWTVDVTRPRVGLDRSTTLFADGRPTRWSWRPTDAHGPLRVRADVTRRPLRAGSSRRTERLPDTARSHAARVRAGEVVCVEVRATDVVGLRSDEVRCALGLTSERFLDGRVRPVSGQAFRGGHAAALVPGRPVRTSGADRGYLNTWGLRVLVCPTCGSLEVYGAGPLRRFDLSADRPGIRVLRVIADQTSTRPLRLTGTGRVVVDGYWAGYVPKDR